MAAFHTYPTFRDAETAALATYDKVQALPEGTLAFVITANPDANGTVAFAPLYLIRHVRWLNIPVVHGVRDAIVALGHRVHVGGETSGPGDQAQDA